MDDEDKQYADETLSEKDEFGAHGMHIDGEEDEDAGPVEVEEDAEDDSI